MRTICYLRVSSRKTNGTSRQSTDSQKLALRRYCSLQGIKRPEYVEDFASGRNQERPGFKAVMEQARAGKLDCLIIWKLDRLGRSMIETIRTIQELLELSVSITVTTQGLVFDQSPYSTFLIALFAALAELESNHASERIKAGLQVARERGVRLGRKIDTKQRDKLIKWQELRVPVKVQATRLGISPRAVYAMRKRIKQEAA